ncbi:ABC transporter permease [Hoeflea poritis]|uniref:ABC transporter permease n=1 Tax=Hoeflea poritis TaxID=2993659 RepID=A0ABT4VUA0_9HYPH|nr:ABC transporter permease [Hoeflea poritis]MDA4848285.1 ABC transporter permease [Hoeflea poritis]
MIAWLFNLTVETQREIYLAFGERIKLYAETGDWSELAVFLPMGVVFGIVHALMPGHSKTLLAAYTMATPASAWRAAGTGLILSSVHILMSVLIVLLSLPLVSVTFGASSQTPVLETLSRGLLALVGIWMIVSSLRPQAHAHLAGRSVAFAFFAGLIPCPLSFFVMVFAVSRGVTEAGLAFALVMLVGVAMVLVSVALAANLSRKGLSRFLENNGKTIRIVTVSLQVATGIILLVAAWRIL